MENLVIPLAAAGLVIAFLAWRNVRPGQNRRTAWAVPLFLLAALLLIGSGYDYWYFHRPLPGPVRRDLFQGITYQREILDLPRPLVVHRVTVDLDAPGLSFLVTPEDPWQGRHLRGRTVSEFLEATGVQLAINAGPFAPWHSRGPIDYYPHRGDPVDPFGVVVSRGHAYGQAATGYDTFYLTRDNRASIGTPLDDIYNAVSGFRVLVRDGRLVGPATHPAQQVAPRTAVALGASGRKLLFLIVDGRQPNYSEGVTPAELADIALRHGAHSVLNLDGGGSSTLVIEGPDGRPVVLNSPIHGHVPPGRERPVATHLGIFAQRTRAAP